MTKKRLKKQTKRKTRSTSSGPAVLPRPLAIQPEEREVLEPRQKMTVSECALNKRILSSKTSKLYGPWLHDYVPFAVEIMDSLSMISLRQVTVMACSQSSKTEIGLNFLLWIFEEMPGPTGLFLPREDDLNRRVNVGVRSMFEVMPFLRRHLPGGRIENLNVGKETVLDNMILFVGWAGSAAALADMALRFAIVDEVGKFKPKIGAEADPISLIRDRFRTFSTEWKLYCPSTPVKEKDIIDREFKDGDQRQWWAKCPFCGEFHILSWWNVQLDKGPDGHLLSHKEYEAGGHSRYICPHCKKPWTEKDRWQAVTNGKWAPKGCTVNKKGRIIGEIPITTHRSYHISALMLYPKFQTINGLAKEWAKAIVAKKKGDIGPLQNFYNSELGEPFEEREKETEESVLVGHRGTYKSGIVPAKVQLITAGLDVQLDHVWFSVDGWAPGMEAFTIAEGRIETSDTSLLENFKLVEELLAKPWTLEADKNSKGMIFRAAIDCGYRPDVVKTLCVKHNDILIPVRGDRTVGSGKVYRATKESGVLGSRQLNFIRYDLNTNSLKDTLYHLLYETTVPGPGYMHLHADTTDETFEHLASEEQRKRKTRRGYEMIWVQKGSKPNHLWDCKVYSLFAAIIAGAMWLKEPEPAKPKQEKIQRQGTRKIRTKY